jgi:hypothetical protein
VLFTSTESTEPECVHSGGKTYLAVDHTANIRKGTAPSWIWDHGDELRLLAGPSLKRTGIVPYVASSSLSIVPQLTLALIFARSTGYIRKELSQHRGDRLGKLSQIWPITPSCLYSHYRNEQVQKTFNSNYTKVSIPITRLGKVYAVRATTLTVSSSQGPPLL